MKLTTIFFCLILLVLSSCKVNKSAVQLKPDVKVQPEVIDVKSKVINANSKTASLRAGENYWENVWQISPKINPHTWYVMPEPNNSIKATFITDIDSISFDVKEKETYEFQILLNQKDTAVTQIKGVGAKAFFSDSYQKKYRDKTVIEIPKPYELINIAFALTSLSAEENSHVVVKNIPYHKEVMEYFAPYKSHEIVTKLDSILRERFNMYFGLKMDTYAFEFKNQKLVSKGVYDRIAQNVGENNLTPELVSLLEDFSKVSKFHEFYNQHQDFYDTQINYYKHDINIANMQLWLNQNFTKTSYDCFKVIFSPLVDWNQSASWFDNDGFKEAQAHVNFPYPSEADKKRTDEENKVLDGNILFTELNHAFINPEAEDYFDTSTFKEAFEDVSFWVTENSVAAKSYANSRSLFNELMNWSLVSLYLLDNAPKGNIDTFIKSTEDWQITKRGFKHFREFNQNLITLYKNKKQEETVADLYPEIIKWCQEFALQGKN